VPPLVCIQSLFVRLLLIRQPDNTMASTKLGYGVPGAPVRTRH
jgi:hypothetical protein